MAPLLEYCAMINIDFLYTILRATVLAIAIVFGGVALTLLGECIIGPIFDFFNKGRKDD